MYYPKQIPYLLDQEYKKYIDYREYHIKELSDYCMCIWEMRSRIDFDKTIYNNILPDACIDIVVDFLNKTICFAGFSAETEPMQLHDKIDSMGVRLKPGAFKAIFHLNADDIMDNPIPFGEIEKDCDLTIIFSNISSEVRISVLKKYLLDKISDAEDTTFIEIVDNLYQNPQDQKVHDIATHFHYNQRQLFRMFKKHYGISPKVLLNILRLHLCLTLILEGQAELIDISMRCGFYDQAHFIKEIKRYTGISPLQLLKAIRD